MTTIRTEAFRRIEADETGFSVTCTASDTTLHVALTADERRTLAAALTADQGGQSMVPARPVTPEEQGELWARIRDELRGEYPSATDYDHRKLDIAASAAADAAIEWLNAHHPKPDPGAMSENYTPEGVDIVMRNLADARLERDAAVERVTRRDGQVDQIARQRDEARAELENARLERDGAFENYKRMRRERDAAVERAEAAEKRHTWPKTTPTGHTYVEPRTYEALCHEHGNAAQAAIESWDADECPPEPTWEMAGIAHREVERLQRERDEWKARAEAAKRERDACGDRLDRQGQSIATLQGDFLRVERERNEAVARAEQAENARDTVATRAGQLEKAIEAHKAGLDIALDRIRELKAKPNVAVSRADIEKALRECTNDVFASHAYPHMADAVCDLFGIEAEQDVDPVEAEVAMAWAEYRKDYQPNPDDLTAAHKAFTSGYLAARHVLGQEASDE